MSRLDDLIDLIQSANEVYLINPKRNARLAFIQIDDLCELAMKSWLQIDTYSRQDSCLKQLKAQCIVSDTSSKHEKAVKDFFAREQTQAQLEVNLGISRNTSKKHTLDAELLVCSFLEGFLEDWVSKDENGNFKGFETVIREIKARRSAPSDQPLHDVLNSFSDRRKTRNNFFHNQDLSGLTVSEEQCLLAFLDLYKLAYLCFGNDFLQKLLTNPIVQAQMILMKLKLRFEKTTVAAEHYRQILNKRGMLSVHPGSFGYDLCFLYEDAVTFTQSIKNHFDSQILDRQNKMDDINRKQRVYQKHRDELVKLQAQINLLNDVVNECLS